MHLTTPEQRTNPTPEAGMGLVNITLNGSNGGMARTLVPTQIDVSKLYFVLTFTGKTGNEEITKTINGQNSFTLQIPVGTWDLNIMGFASASDTAESSKALVEGSRNDIDVLPGNIPTINITLTPNESKITQTGSGTLQYEIVLPAGATGTLTVFTLDGTRVGSPLSYTASSSNTGKLSLISGFYLISLTTSYNGMAKTWTELAQIYDTSITELTHEFTVEDITNSATAGIINFSFLLPYGYYPINNTAKTINVIVPSGTDITALTPVINYSGIMIDPAPEGPVDFTNPVTYTVYAENGIINTYTVTVSDTIYDTTVLAAYLSSFSVNTVDDPIPVKVNVNLDSSWTSLMNALNSAGRYVDLDLSDCTGMTTFDPSTSSAGKNRVVSLTLPTITTSTTWGSLSNPTFYYFSSLKTVKGINVTSLGVYSFNNCTSLETVYFPSLIGIGNYAFYACTRLTNVTLPTSVTIIGSSAFQGCGRLISMTIPESVTSIGNLAFSGCAGLTSVTFNGIIPSLSTSTGSFPGDLTTKYLAGGIGTYTCPSGSSTWTKQ